jgi:hypothetical protein
MLPALAADGSRWHAAGCAVSASAAAGTAFAMVAISIRARATTADLLRASRLGSPVDATITAVRSLSLVLSSSGLVRVERLRREPGSRRAARAPRLT